VLGDMSQGPTFSLPRLYAIADNSLFLDERKFFEFIETLVAGGVTLLQYRNKSGSSRQMLNQAREIKHRAGDSVRLIMNDRSDLCVMAGFDGVHLGQDDLSADGARQVVGAGRVLGVSTHNVEQVIVADETSADYVAIGPVFATSSKVNPDPVVGLEGVRRARALTRKPLVAIGGITRENCSSVIEAGADSVAVISELLLEPGKTVRDFLAILG
jgi:thiamine-phosphate pyrophosphorylase